MPISEIFEKLKSENDSMFNQLALIKGDWKDEERILVFLRRILAEAHNLTNLEDHEECAQFIKFWNVYLPPEKRIRDFIYDFFPKDKLTMRLEQSTDGTDSPSITQPQNPNAQGCSKMKVTKKSTLDTNLQEQKSGQMDQEVEHLRDIIEIEIGKQYKKPGNSVFIPLVPSLFTESSRQQIVKIYKEAGWNIEFKFGNGFSSITLK